jgi:tubulin-specific chaperone D
VVVRFLNVETKYLELLLSAIEKAEYAETEAGSTGSSVKWTWEERYVILLWLSHLFLAPFDLSTISSVDMDDLNIPTIPNLAWPPKLPSITLRILPLAIKYLESPGKESDAAKALLVRIAMRKDMQELGVLHALIRWALRSLRPNSKDEAPPRSSYYYIGILSFLAGILRASADTSDLDKYLSDIFNVTFSITADDGPSAAIINSSTLARKMIIKVVRSVAILILRQPSQSAADTEIVESSITYLLESLSISDTPVRFSASKALSIITLRLDPFMAAQVVEAVLDSLKRNVFWVKDPTDPYGKRTRDLSAVDPLEWHGLTLTLAHLLYRRSPPADQLSDIVHSLLLGLSFEQRNASGGSIGTNVRDAACFGIWALARRYTTQELLQVPTKSVYAAKAHSEELSILQVLATELVVTATLDLSGNIRRGSSAALQELIGRHPDTVDNGIWVVQAVDYHAVARRSRAVQDVALKVTKLSGQYGEAILDSILGWRGIGDIDAGTRRAAASSFGALTLELAKARPSSALTRFTSSVAKILQRIKGLQTRQAEERHGLYLCFAAVLDKFPDFVSLGTGNSNLKAVDRPKHIDPVIDAVIGILLECKNVTYRRPELIAEASSRLVVSLFPIVQAESTLDVNESPDLGGVTLVPGWSVVSNEDGRAISRHLFDHTRLGKEASERISKLGSALGEVVDVWLSRNERETISAVSEASVILMMLLSPQDRDKVIRQWTEAIRLARSGRGHGYFYALAMTRPFATDLGERQSDKEDLVSKVILDRWRAESEIEAKVAILQSLWQSKMLRQQALVFLDVLMEALGDYTTNARGDIGSHVRVEAVRAVMSLWKGMGTIPEAATWLKPTASKLLLRVLSLSAEKLDRVRADAHVALSLALDGRLVYHYL